MTIDNLNYLLKKFTFLREHHPLDRSTSITVANEYIDISIVINSPVRSLAMQANEESVGNEYDIYPVIKDILSYFGLTHEYFGRLLIKEMTHNKLRLMIYTSDFWTVGKAVYEEYGHSQKIADLMEEDLPIPLSEENINKAKEAALKRIKSSFRYPFSNYITYDIINQAFDSVTPVRWQGEPISVTTSNNSSDASLSF